MENKIVNLEQNYELLLKRFISLESNFQEAQVKNEAFLKLEKRIENLENCISKDNLRFTEYENKYNQLKELTDKSLQMSLSFKEQQYFCEITLQSISNKIETVESSSVRTRSLDDVVIKSIVNKIDIIEKSYKEKDSFNEIAIKSLLNKIDTMENSLNNESIKYKELHNKYSEITDLLDKSLQSNNLVKEKQSFDGILLNAVVNKVDNIEKSYKERQISDEFVIKSIMNKLNTFDISNNKKTTFDEIVLKSLLNKTDAIEKILNEERIRYDKLEVKFSEIKDSIVPSLNNISAKEKNAISYEKMFPNLANKTDKLQQNIKNSLRRFPASPIRSGTMNDSFTNTIKNYLLTTEFDKSLFYKTLVSNNLFKDLISDKKITMLFKASNHNFLAKKFHEICDKKSNTIVFVKSDTSRVFGGYTNCMWTTSNKKSEELENLSFLFSIDRNIKLPLINSQEKTVFCQDIFGPTFGSGYDLYICDQCDVNEYSYSEIGHSFMSPQDLNKFEKKTFLADKEKFKVLEYEVFQLI